MQGVPYGALHRPDSNVLRSVREIIAYRWILVFSNILVPLDGSKYGEKALDAVKNITDSNQLTVHLIVFVSSVPKSGINPHGSFQAGAPQHELDQPRRFIDHQLGMAGAYLQTMKGMLHGTAIKEVTAIREGIADEQILDYARENDIDLIVMSVHGHEGVRSSFLEGVIDRVVRPGEIPILVVPGT